ncbi:putative ribonuclease H-like domain-containing protein, partial [Tanacetum coccineum]
ISILQVVSEQGISCDDVEDLDDQQFIVHVAQPMHPEERTAATEVPLSSKEQALHDELVSLMHQESLAKLHNDDQRIAFEEEKKRIALDKGKECVDSTFTLSTANTPPQSTGNTPTDSDDDIPKDGVFSTKSFDDENTDTEEGGNASSHDDVDDLDDQQFIVHGPNIHAAQHKPSEERTANKEIPLSSEEQALHDELVNLMHQESLAKAHNDDQRIAFEEEKRRISIAKGKEHVNSTFTLSTANTPPQSAGNTPTDSDDDIPKDGVFSTNSFDAEEGGVADYNNMDSTIDVPSTPTLRIHKKVLLTNTKPCCLSYTSKTELITKISRHACLLVYVDDIIFGSTKSSMVKDFEELMQKEFKMSSTGELITPCVFKSLTTSINVYVDDIIFGSTKSSMVKDFEELMQKEFKMSSMGELTFFLGLQVKQSNGGIFLSQDKYVKDILHKFDFRTIKPASTPIEAHKSLGKDERRTISI